jgi:excisionase family DNA binding protein
METTYSELLNKPMLKVQETAHVLGVNHKTVREMISKGELPCHRLVARCAFRRRPCWRC